MAQFIIARSRAPKQSKDNKKNPYKKLFLVLLSLGIMLSIQTATSSPYRCEHTYALCIAASCDRSGVCGACDSDDGSCGYCYVFTGDSYSYRKKCEELTPSNNIVYSTYSNILSLKYNFKSMNCPNIKLSANCMNARCELTGKKVRLNEDLVPTAICYCTIEENSPINTATLGGKCNTQRCSTTIWSTAIPSLLSYTCEN